MSREHHVNCETIKCGICGEPGLICEMVPAEDRGDYACNKCFSEMEPEPTRYDS